MKDALDVHRSLLAREVPHEIVRLPRLVLSADEIPEVMGLPAASGAAVRLYQADERVVAVVVRSGDLPHPGAVLAAAGARTLRTLPADQVHELTDFAATLVCPVLLPEHFLVLADACVGHQDVVYTATGEGGTVLGIPSRWLLTASRAVVSELCAPQAPTLDLSGDLGDTRALSPRQPGWR